MATTQTSGAGTLPDPQSPVSAFVEGKRVSFGSAQQKFDALIHEWKRLYDHGSSTESPLNDAYGQIVAMGWPAVPFLLREVERQSGHWFAALRWITGADVAKPEMKGNIRLLREAWLRWGKQNDIQF